MAIVTSENILKLRELTEKICSVPPKGEYETVLSDVKSIVKKGEDEVEKTFSSNQKIKCYEQMFKKINNILKNVKN